MHDLDAWRDEWPYLETGQLWLQHAGITPLCRRVMRAGVRAMETFAAEPRGGYREVWQQATDGARAALAQLFGCAATDLALVKNTSLGIVQVAFGYPYRPGQNVVIVAGEYPANRLPWRAAVPDGVELRVVEPLPDGRLPVDHFAAAMDADTCLLAVSWVQYLNGFRVDLPALGELCERHGTCLVVDGVQGAGCLPVDLAPVDAFACGGHKWLCGPEGAGVLYVAPRLLDRLQTYNVSWHSTAERLDRPGAEVPTEAGVPPLKPTAERFEEGTPNTVGCIMLAEAARMLTEIGPEQVWSSVAAWHDALVERLAPRGYEVTSSRRESERSGILSLRHPGHETNALVQRLLDDDITCLRRGDSVRLSPHFYCNEEDVERVSRVLP